jgi:hypothetical protein
MTSLQPGLRFCFHKPVLLRLGGISIGEPGGRLLARSKLYLI